METTDFIDVLEREGTALADAAAEAGPDAPVPTCPGWQVRDLLRHTGVVHHWGIEIIEERHARPVRSGDEPDLDGDELVAWYRESHRLVVATLRSAPADLDCWTFLPAPSPLAFWARRAAHETTVHRADADTAAAPRPGGVATDFALDGIDELLVGFHGQERSRVRSAAPRSLRVRASGTGDVWTVRMSPEAPRVERSTEGVADCEVAGSASDLYLALWNRLDVSALEVSGDSSLLRVWAETSAIVRG